MKHLPFILVLSALLVAGHSAKARTWSVEQDGSGDWATIQEAVDASASGDTIMIGAGRYSEIHPVPGTATTTAVAHLLEVKDLTLVGMGPEESIIGPESITETCAVFFIGVTSAFAVSGVQIVNSHAGIWAYGNIELKQSTFDGCWIGCWVDGGDVWASNCTFLPPVPAPTTTLSFNINSSSDAIIEGCHFTDLNVYLDSVTSSTIRDCVFEHPIGNNAGNSVKFVSSNGVFEGNRTDGRVVCQGNSNVVLRENEFLTGLPDVSLLISEQYAEVEIYDNVFHGSSFSTIFLRLAPSLSGSGNHILNDNSGGFSVRLQYYGDYNNNPVVDLRNNYWGTDDPAQIDAWIYDIHDDPNEDTEVLYEPFSDVPLPTEKRSLGGFKSLYR